MYRFPSRLHAGVWSSPHNQKTDTGTLSTTANCFSSNMSWWCMKINMFRQRFHLITWNFVTLLVKKSLYSPTPFQFHTILSPRELTSTSIDWKCPVFNGSEMGSYHVPRLCYFEIVCRLLPCICSHTTDCLSERYIWNTSLAVWKIYSLQNNSGV